MQLLGWEVFFIIECRTEYFFMSTSNTISVSKENIFMSNMNTKAKAEEKSILSLTQLEWKITENEAFLNRKFTNLKAYKLPSKQLENIPQKIPW